MKLTSIATVPSLVLPLVVAVACGARSPLDDDGLGGASAADDGPSSTSRGNATTASTAQTANATTGSIATGQPFACSSLRLAGDPVTVPAEGNAFVPELGLLPSGRAVIAWLRPGGLLLADEIDAFGAWPPAFPSPTPVVENVESYRLGAGTKGPVAFVAGIFGDSFLARSLVPFDAIGFPGSINTQAVSVAGLEEAFLFGTRGDVGDVRLFSLAPTVFLNPEAPGLCTDRPLVATTPAAGGILGAYGTAFVDFCDVGFDRPTHLVTARHDLTATFEDAMEATSVVDVLEVSEPIEHVSIAPASFGAWVVFQTDGSTSLTAPPINALRIGSDAAPLDRDLLLHRVSPEGAEVRAAGATSMLDAVAVAYVDAIDPSAPTIVVQRVEAGGELGALASIPTQVAWLSGNVRMVTSPAADSILVSWEGEDVIGLARLDCAGP